MSKRELKQCTVHIFNIYWLLFISFFLAVLTGIIWEETLLLLYVFFWVIPRRLNFICRRFGTLCLFHLQRQAGVKWPNLRIAGLSIREKVGSEIAWADWKEGDRVTLSPSFQSAQAISEPTFSRMDNPTILRFGHFYTYLPLKMEQSVPKRRHIKFRRRGITQKKTQHTEHAQSLKSRTLLLHRDHLSWTVDRLFQKTLIK